MESCESLESNITRTATVFVRHAAACPDAKRGSDWRKCDCRKSILIYDGATAKQRKVSAKTRSWEKAEAKAREWLDQFDPVKVELRKLQAEKERSVGKAVRIEEAVARYLADMRTRLGEGCYIKRAYAMLGTVAADGTIERNGKLFDWLNRQTPRPILINELTPSHIADWRGTWGYKSDLSAYQAFADVKTFFKFCLSQHWITENPAAQLKYPKKSRGNRTGTFTDEQYDAIVAAAKGNQLLHIFLELCRWGALALVDAVLFDKKDVDAEGVLRYRRKKSGTLATVKLPEHVQVLVRSLPTGQPFRNMKLTLDSDLDRWRDELQKLFEQAGITAVKTDVGMRPPHPHMLRDTCAVWLLRQGMGIHGVAKVLGHSNPTITAKHYLPFVAELEKAHIAEMAEILKAARPKVPARVVSIAGRTRSQRGTQVV